MGEPLLSDERLVRHAVEDFSETYASVTKGVERLHNLFRVVDTCRRRKPPPQLDDINALINRLKTLERYIKKSSQQVKQEGE